MNTRLTPASSAIVIHGGRYLLVRRGKPPAADMYAFPGGRGEPDEAPEATALRELHEETALHGENPRFFATFDLPGKHGGGYRLSVFLVDCGDVKPLMAADDAVEAGWFSAEEIALLPVPDSVAECVRRLESSRKVAAR